MQKGLYGLDYIVSTKVREVGSKLNTKPKYANKLNYIYFILRCPPILGSSVSELRLESFAKVEDLKHNSELPLYASEQDNPSGPK